MMDSLEIMTVGARLGDVTTAGDVDDQIRGFIEKLVVPGGLEPGDEGYTQALYDLLRSGTYLWAQPLD